MNWRAYKFEALRSPSNLQISTLNQSASPKPISVSESSDRLAAYLQEPSQITTDTAS
ncbi:MAG TPA: hypothetical protein V6C84_04175 [Coleofasciculaceae cyanobacterium]